MCDSLKTSLRWLGTGCFLALVLFITPNCILQTGGLGDPGGTPNPCDTNDPKGCDPECDPTKTECTPPCEGPDCPPDPCDTPDCNMPPDPTTVFAQGTNPVDSIMCDFPNAEKQGVSACATQAEVDSGVYLSQSTGATSLATSQSNALTLDWSPAAMLECSGLPKKVQFLGGPFPDGQQVCIDAAQQFPNVYANPTKACIAKCEDVIAMGPGPFPVDIHDYCVNNARTSTNFDKNSWYPNTCTAGGNPIIGLADPRRTPEPVQWTNLINTSDNGGTLTKTGATNVNFDAGAGSTQTITTGDAWVEFAASEIDTGHALSLRTSCADPVNCEDMDPTTADLGYAINLGGDGMVYVLETVNGQQTFGPFGPYTAGERYRIHATDRHDGTAAITYARIVGACMEGTICTEDVFYTSIAAAPAYPLRVDAALRTQNSSLVNVNLVRIK